MKKETLERDYFVNNLTHNEIAEKYNVSRSTISRRFKEFNIPIKPKHTNVDKILSDIELEFIFGKLLGDGCITKGQDSLNYRLEFAHSIKQKDYINFCYDYIKDWCYNPPIYRTQNRNPNIYSTPTLEKYCLSTISHPEFSRLHKYFYDHGVKIINTDILNSLTPLSLAIWYQDDGSIEIDHRKNKVTGAKIATNQFPLESVQLICDWFRKTYGINCNPNKTQMGKNGLPQYCVRFSKSSLKTFFDLIKPYISTDLHYKIEYDIVQSS